MKKFSAIAIVLLCLGISLPQSAVAAVRNVELIERPHQLLDGRFIDEINMIKQYNGTIIKLDDDTTEGGANNGNGNDGVFSWDTAISQYSDDKISSMRKEEKEKNIKLFREKALDAEKKSSEFLTESLTTDDSKRKEFREKSENKILESKYWQRQVLLIEKILESTPSGEGDWQIISAIYSTGQFYPDVDYKYKYILGGCAVHCLSDMRFNIPPGNEDNWKITKGYPTPKCLLNYTEFKCHPSVDQVLIHLKQLVEEFKIDNSCVEL